MADVDRIAATALKLWEHADVTLAITGNLLGSRNGYLRLPERFGGALEDLQAPRPLVYGPDAYGWVGFDLIHTWDVWTPDDPGEMAVDELTRFTQELMAGIGRDVQDPVVWTTELLSDALEAMAERARAAV